VIARGTRVRSKSELVSLLERWYRGTIETTIGKVGAFGRTRWIHIDLESGRAVLNGDTTRDAVGDYLSDAAEHGAEAPWWIVRNRDGRINKVVFKADFGLAPGWYCYLSDERSEPGEL